MYKNCLHCGSFVPADSRFCGQCGKTVQESEWTQKKPIYYRIIAFYLAIILFIAGSSFVYIHTIYGFYTELTIELLFVLLVLGFSITGYQAIKPLFERPSFDKDVWLFTIAFPVVSSILVYYLMDALNSWSGVGLSNYYLENSSLDYPLTWSIISVAILPPIFEELAFRGYLFNQLYKVTSWKITVIVTAFLFALIHFSMISFLWIFPFGLVLGYMRYRYNSLWLVMLIHFIHNLIVIILDYYYAQTLPFDAWY